MKSEILTYRIAAMLVILTFSSCKFSNSQEVVASMVQEDQVAAIPSVIVGAEQLAEYIPQLTRKSCAVVVNQSSMVGENHLVDTLLALEVQVKRIFVPEHGFRGKADAGQKIDDTIDDKSKLPIISLYGKNRKPKESDLEDLDVILFDLQDVGVRCYTYISTLHNVMSACAENNVKIIVLDRPNPNGHYVDGPVLNSELKSFIGMHPVPFVHGMTIGEYAQLINGESWLDGGQKAVLQVIPCSNYSRYDRYELPIPPSPNLKSYRSVLLYPSLVFFEGTQFSVGRGTETPFEVFGHPKGKGDFQFTPRPGEGASSPKLNGQRCTGVSLRSKDPNQIHEEAQINMSYLLEAFSSFDSRESFFLDNGFFNKLSGTTQLKQDILLNKTELQIRETWKDDIEHFKTLRRPYLIYEE